MHIKYGEADQRAFFRHTPPMGEWSDDGRGINGFPNAEPWQLSVYYFWWAYLRENADYRACCDDEGAGPLSELYRDFGDVRGDDFREWWTNIGRDLFREPDHEPIIFHEELPHRLQAETHVLLSIPVTGDLDRVLREMRNILKDGFQRERDRRREQGNARRSPTAALYPVKGKPVVSTLWRRLCVWQHLQRDPGADKFLVGVACGHIHQTDVEKADAYRRNMVKTEVSKDYKEAGRLIRNVIKGRFPDFSDA